MAMVEPIMSATKSVREVNRMEPPTSSRVKASRSPRCDDDEG
jgi:hypothetical protein